MHIYMHTLYLQVALRTPLHTLFMNQWWFFFLNLKYHRFYFNLILVENQFRPIQLTHLKNKIKMVGRLNSSHPNQIWQGRANLAAYQIWPWEARYSYSHRMRQYVGSINCLWSKMANLALPTTLYGHIVFF